MSYHVLIYSILVSISAISCEDWTVTCNLTCQCSWVFGKPSANCAYQNLFEIPTNLSSPLINYIDFSNNYFYTLNDYEFSQANLRNLRRLILRNCSVERINEAAFFDLISLNEIDLSRNQINSLTDQVFQHNKQLQIVNLNYNNISVLGDLFHNLSSLQEIKLNHNQIHTVSRKTFFNLPSLRKIYLSYNKIQLITFDLKRFLPKLNILEVGCNPWVCDCHLQEFRQSIIRNKLDTNSIKCHSPIRMKGRLWDDDIVFKCASEIYSKESNNVSLIIGQQSRSSNQNAQETISIKSIYLFWIASFFVVLVVALFAAFVYFSRRKDLTANVEEVYVPPDVPSPLMEINPVTKPPRIQDSSVNANSNFSDVRTTLNQSGNGNFGQLFGNEGFSASLNYSNYTLYSPHWGTTEQFSNVPPRHRPQNNYRTLGNCQLYLTLPTVPYFPTSNCPRIYDHMYVTLPRQYDQNRELGSTNNTARNVDERYAMTSL